MDMSLSLRITSKLPLATPALLRASKAMPAVMAPSPITAMARRVSPLMALAMAIPRAAEMLVEEWAVPKASNSLSSRRGKPLKPPSWRKVAMRSRRSVSILWG